MHPAYAQRFNTNCNAAIPERRMYILGTHGGGDEYLTQHLANAMLRKAKPETVVADGLKSSIVCFGIDKAQKYRRVVSLNPMWKKAGIRLR